MESTYDVALLLASEIVTMFDTAKEGFIVKT